jgi:hypothetical protein
MATEDVAQEETMGLEGIGGKQETADGDGVEVVGSFEDGWLGKTTFSMTVAGDEAGDVAFDKVLVEVG